jgi:hypothetical protein
MLFRANSLSVAVFAIPLLTFFTGGPAARAASVPTKSLEKSNPRLSVRVYSFAGLSRWLVQTAEMEAARLLRDVPLDLAWVDCTSRLNSAACMSEPTPAELVVRVVAKALPQANADTLGIAGTNAGDAIAFIFYDRMLALRTETKPLPFIFGRVLAHEITHLLLSSQSHSELGLMRGQWTADDLRPESNACMGLPAASVQLMQKEALRRMLSARQVITPQR